MSPKPPPDPEQRSPQLSRWTTQTLLFLAAALITNSHLELFYPISQMAGDGLLGNGLFFMIAGMGITLSAQGKSQAFTGYYWRRIKRIYPVVVVVVTLFIVLLGGQWRTWSWSDAVSNYIYPTPWAFIAYIMVYYLIFYALLQRPQFLTFAIPFAVAFIPFAYFWWAHPQGERLRLGSLHDSIYWIFWFQCMLLGGCLATSVRRSGRTYTSDGILLFVLFGFYIALKFAFVTGRVASFHFALFPLVLVLLYLLFRIMNSVPSQTFRLRLPRAARAINWISSRTLEIYTIQGFLAYREELAHLKPFPLNIAAFLTLLLVLVWLVHRLVVLVNSERTVVA